MFVLPKFKTKPGRTIEDGEKRQVAEVQTDSALERLSYPTQRTIGFRAAVTSSTRLVRVVCGAPVSFSGSSSTSFAIEIMASMNKSNSCFDSVSVGSIMSAPCTINGKLTV